MRRLIPFLILASMLLHTAYKTGIISVLRSERHYIAYSLGLIQELPIAVCSPEYFAENAPLVVQEAEHQQDAQMPKPIQVEETILFLEQVVKVNLEKLPLYHLNHFTGLISRYYSPPLLDIFQPPS